MGFETEYAIKVNSEARKAGFQLDFHRFIGSLSNEIPLAPSIRNPFRFFLANGGCVSLEHGSSASIRHALLESATPECTSPRELIAYQIANERLLAETIESTFVETDACLLKGCSDAHGHLYGQHESYEVEIASSWRLSAWRIGLILLLPLLLCYRIAAALWISIIWLAANATTQIYRSPKTISAIATFAFRKTKAWLQKQPMEYADEDVPSTLAERLRRIHPVDPLGMSPRWLSLCAFGLRVLHAPLAMAFWFNIYLFALVPHRRHLSAFFASRCVVDGAGFLDPENRFWLSLRSSLTTTTIGFGSYRNSRPIFRCDPWLRNLCSDSFFSLSSYLNLFNSRQRIEIALGDSGLCEQSQYVRVGATSLALDLVESGHTQNLPRIRDALGAMRRFARDWMLLCSVPDRDRKQWTALELQHAYAAAVRNMLQDTQYVPQEAWKILDQWQTTLNQLGPSEDEKDLPRSMLGRVDWLSKLWLLDQINRDSPWNVRKKVDLRYHELSANGYQWRLMQMLQIAPIIDQQEIDRARRLPPQGTPAIKRGYLIREFANTDANLHVDWNVAVYWLEGKRQSSRFEH